MTNISSKKWKYESVEGIGYVVTNLLTNESKNISMAIAHPSHLAAISEAQFDRIFDKAWKEN